MALEEFIELEDRIRNLERTIPIAMKLARYSDRNKVFINKKWSKGKHKSITKRLTVEIMRKLTESKS